MNDPLESLMEEALIEVIPEKIKAYVRKLVCRGADPEAILAVFEKDGCGELTQCSIVLWIHRCECQLSALRRDSN